MAYYALIVDGVVRERLATEANIAMLFHPEMHWVQLTTEQANVEPGWRFRDGVFLPRAPAMPVASAAPSLGELQDQMARLSAQITQLASHA
jgi:hypothetical protein